MDEVIVIEEVDNVDDDWEVYHICGLDMNEVDVGEDDEEEEDDDDEFVVNKVLRRVL